jgi:hypothetical protein
MQATQAHAPRAAADAGRTAEPGVLSAQELLAGSALVHEIAVPAEVLRPGSGADGVAGTVRMRPVRVGTLALIARAAREDPSLVPLLMVRDAVVEPTLELEQIRQLHAGLLHFLVERANAISGLGTSGDARAAAASPLGETHVLLAKHFGWTPQQVAELTPGQVAVYLAGVERLLALDAAQAAP